MLGYDISWAAFNIIEVMSASKFTFKVRRGGGCALAGDPALQKGSMHTSLGPARAAASAIVVFFLNSYLRGVCLPALRDVCKMGS